MKEYKIKIEVNSPLLLGSGEGWSSLIDIDIVFDNYGLPYFPARRLKGLLRESALEVVEMFDKAKLDCFWDKEKEVLDSLFGKKGDIKGSFAHFNNLYVPQYEDVVSWLKWAFKKFPEVVTIDAVLDVLTEVRQQTAVNNDGTVRPNSLRTLRVLKPGAEFEGKVTFEKEDETAVKLLALACVNLRHIGSNRSRGFGEVTCSLWEKDRDVSSHILEELKGGI